MKAQTGSNNVKTIELNTGWQFKEAGFPSIYPATVPGCVHTDLLANKIINDPFYRTNERDEQWVDKVNWEYQTTFDITPDVLAKSNIILDFMGLDTYADVYLNDTKLLSANNMFREWQVDCKKVLKDKKNILRVYFHSPIFMGLQELEKNGYPLPASNDLSEIGGLGFTHVSNFIRKAPFQFGWDWGPRFVTSGIWRPVYIKAWNDIRIDNIYFSQEEITDASAKLIAHYQIECSTVQTARLEIKSNATVLANKELHLNQGDNKIDVAFEIKNPKLWWSNGLGEQYLYNLTSLVHDKNLVVDEAQTKIGVRTLTVEQDLDKDGKGKSFYIKLNNVAVFAKGADYIPNDIFLTRVSPENYEHIVKSAADAHMNILRVWGGGIYENDIFYDLCDKYGIMVWQDFMFACSMYPGDDDFLDNVKQEAIDNVIRLRNHPCIALWCGNNEIESGWGEPGDGNGWGWKSSYSKEQKNIIWKNYMKIFNEILPGVVKSNTKNAFYWRTSPYSGSDNVSTYESRSGDMHYWGVWHGKQPFSDYNKYIGRFMSEYGFQSFPEFKTVETYTKPEDYDIQSEVMAWHQRSGNGNMLIKDYMKNLYREPKDFKSFLYISQVLQAEAIKAAIEAHRRNMPYTMGTIFWQLNDCWPVASWSSIDYYGRWKALQYFAKKAYAETVIMPYLENDSIKIFLATDRINSINAEVQLNAIDFSGNQVWTKSLPVEIQHNKGIMVYEAGVKDILNGKDRKNVFLKASLKEGDSIIANNVLYLLPAKDLELSKPVISKTIEKTANGYSITLSTDKLARNVFLSLEKNDGFFTDNYFDILPGEKINIQLLTKQPIVDIEKQLQILSLVDSY